MGTATIAPSREQLLEGLLTHLAGLVANAAAGRDKLIGTRGHFRDIADEVERTAANGAFDSEKAAHDSLISTANNLKEVIRTLPPIGSEAVQEGSIVEVIDSAVGRQLLLIVPREGCSLPSASFSLGNQTVELSAVCSCNLIAKALLGKQPGETATWRGPEGDDCSCKVVSLIS